MIVADTNVIAYLLISGERSSEAEEARTIDSDWAVPVLWKSEFNNVLALYIRKNLMTLDDTIELAEEAERLIGENEYEVPAYRVLTLVDSSPRSAYDCEFIALAQDLGVQLVTVDKKLLASFPETAISLSDFVASNR